MTRIRIAALIVTTALAGLATGCSRSSSGDPAGVPGTPATPTANTAPRLAEASADQAAAVGWDFSYDAAQGGAAFTDADGDALSYSISFSPEANGLSASGAAITGVPRAVMTITATVTASDGRGGTASDSFAIDTGIRQTAIAATFGGAIDLASLDNYADPAIPDHIRRRRDTDNPVTDAGATLGRVLFYDTALSVDGTVSCSSCHGQSHAFSDSRVVSRGIEGGTTRRHSMRLVNTGYAEEGSAFWDERAASHEAQEVMPLADHNEHGFSGEGGRPGMEALLTKLEGIAYYEELFRFTFGSPEVTEERLGLALAQFTSSIHSFDSRFDAGLAAAGSLEAPFANFTAMENAGKQLFLATPGGGGGAGCHECHRAPEFDITPGSGTNGVVGEANDPAGFDFTNTRAPSLRDVVRADGTSNGPFMHDGSLASLAAVIDHYDAIEVPDDPEARAEFQTTIDNRLFQGFQPQRLNLTDGEKAQLEAFLRTLAGEAVYTDAKWADPFAPAR